MTDLATHKCKLDGQELIRLERVAEQLRRDWDRLRLLPLSQRFSEFLPNTVRKGRYSFALLVELCLEDLELRLEEGARVEDYFAAFPLIETHRTAPLLLIEREYLLRQQQLRKSFESRFQKYRKWAKFRLPTWLPAED